MCGRTCVVIAHHLSAIRHADVIFVVKDCELVEQGSHEVLLASGGFYSEMYNTQTTERHAGETVVPAGKQRESDRRRNQR